MRLLPLLMSGALFVGIPVSQAKEYRFPAIKSVQAVQGQVSKLVIYSTTDIDVIRPLIEDFQDQAPTFTVHYHDLQSLDLYERVIKETESGTRTADFVLSSAMDLQIKLANDGYAATYVPINVDHLPIWANWRNEAFGITVEPAVIVYNKAYFESLNIPKTRADLLHLLEQRKPDLFGRVATYDVSRSGLGFLFLSRDIELYSATWDLIREMGQNGVKLFSSSEEILNSVSQGKSVLGYNILGSYALARGKTDPAIGVILPEDYTLIMSRIALIPKAANSLRAGQILLEYLLSERGQKALSHKAQLTAVIPFITGDTNRNQIDDRSARPIKVDTSLLVYLDQVKRRKILKRWHKVLSGR